jgi:hypothetical protein
VATGFVTLLAIVAIASGRGRGNGALAGGEPREVPPTLVDYVFSFGVMVAVLLAILAVVVLIGAGGKTELPERRRRSLVGTLIFIALVAGVAGLTTRLKPLEREARVEECVLPAEGDLPRRVGPCPPGERPDPRLQDVQPRPGERQAQFRWEAAAVTGLLVALAAAAFVVAVRRPRRDAAADREPEIADVVSDVLDETLDDLRRERDARRAVVAAYARLEHTLARHGLPRRPFEAPLEYLARILLELEVAPEAVLDLTDLFQQARFSRRTIDESMKDEAIAALVAVRDDLRAAA